MIGDHLLRGAIHLFPDMERRWPAPAIIGTVLAALVFRQLDKRGFPTVNAQPPCIVDRQPKVVADFGPSQALAVVLVKAYGPFAGGILLGKSSAAERGH